MRLRELTKDGFPAWPLIWGGGAYDPRSPGLLPAAGGDNGVLVDARAGAAEPELVDALTGEVKRGVVVEMKLDGRLNREVLEWDDPANAPTPEQVAERLRSHIGTRVGDLRDAEIGER